MYVAGSSILILWVHHFKSNSYSNASFFCETDYCLSCFLITKMSPWWESLISPIVCSVALFTCHSPFVASSHIRVKLSDECRIILSPILSQVIGCSTATNAPACRPAIARFANRVSRRKRSQPVRPYPGIDRQVYVLYNLRISENHFSEKTYSCIKLVFKKPGLWSPISTRDHDIRIQHGRLPIVDYILAEKRFISWWPFLVSNGELI